jgi:hypothetical protein
VVDGVAAVMGFVVGVGYALPVFGVSLYFGERANGKRAQSYADVVDAINRYNDDPRCAP